jgi:catechol 2,3-dioxygenase-like lactoylglutathione lyase family enzyme
MSKIISGIQQIGIGVSNVQEAFDWYKDHFGMDVKVFDDEAEAALMIKYTGGEVRNRQAILALNMQGGGGFEIWQYKSRVPQPADFDIVLGDFGIYVTKMKTREIENAHTFLTKKGVNNVSAIKQNPWGQKHFFVQDLYGNWFQIEESNQWFSDKKIHPIGGVGGTIIGVKDIDEAIKMYGASLGLVVDGEIQEGTFDDLAHLPNGDKSFKRARLIQPNHGAGAFGQLLGAPVLELVQATNYEGKLMFENRYWGDLGYIHLCFDVVGMKQHESDCTAAGYPFTVDSANSFDMGKSAGHFSYIASKDGTLLEFVETHKLPIAPKWGWYLDLRKRDASKNLPKWMLGALRFNRVK